MLIVECWCESCRHRFVIIMMDLLLSLNIGLGSVPSMAIMLCFSISIRHTIICAHSNKGSHGQLYMEMFECCSWSLVWCIYCIWTCNKSLPLLRTLIATVKFDHFSRILFSTFPSHSSPFENQGGNEIKMKSCLQMRSHIWSVPNTLCMRAGTGAGIGHKTHTHTPNRYWIWIYMVKIVKMHFGPATKMVLSPLFCPDAQMLHACSSLF